MSLSHQFVNDINMSENNTICNNQQIDKWTCNKCTYNNYPKAKKCTMCGESRSHCLIIDPFSSKEQSIDIYKMAPPIMDNDCSKEKNLFNCTNTSSNVNSSKWSCHVCTYLNYPRATKCTQCRTAKKMSPSRCTSPFISTSSVISNETNQIHCGSRTNTEHNPITNITASTNDSYYNDKNRLGSVGLVQAGLKWSCSYCTYDNWQAAKKCVICNNQNKTSDKQKNDFQTSHVSIKDAHETNLRTPSPPGAQGLTPSRYTRPINNKEFNLSSADKRNNDYYDILISNSSQPIAKRAPSDVSRYLAAEIRRHISNGLRQRKGDVPCYFVNEFVTFSLPAEILDLPTSIRERLFDEILDRDVQKELEEENIINWSLDLTESRLYALWNRSTGDCLLDSVLQATWGVFDRENILRKALGDSLHDATSALYPRFKETETLQSNLLNYTLDDDQLLEDWAVILSLATQPGQSLEQIHIFTLAHILRRPIIVYAIKIVKSFRGETLGYAGYEGIYLPLLWESSFCWKSPIALGYTRGHFSALVPIEPDNSDAHIGAGANIRATDDSETIYLPLVTSENKLLRLHFLSQNEIGREQEIIRQWLDCSFISGVLVAKQKIPKKPILVAQMMEEWLDFYRNLTPATLAHNVNTNTVQDYSSDESDQE